MDLTVSEGRVYGSRYHTVQPPSRLVPTSGGWYNQYWIDMEKWCTETFGETPKDGVWTPGARWYANNGKFLFKDEADLLLFTLRWQ
jgi:hypothetical protein